MKHKRLVVTVDQATNEALQCTSQYCLALLAPLASKLVALL